MYKERKYLMLNSKDFTAILYTVKLDDFGKIYIQYSEILIEINEAKRYNNPLTHFICKAYKIIQDFNVNGVDYEIIENKTIEYMFNLYNNMA